MTAADVGLPAWPAGVSALFSWSFLDRAASFRSVLSFSEMVCESVFLKYLDLLWRQNLFFPNTMWSINVCVFRCCSFFRCVQVFSNNTTFSVPPFFRALNVHPILDQRASFFFIRGFFLPDVYVYVCVCFDKYSMLIFRDNSMFPEETLNYFFSRRYFVL